jgi:ABC-2 type transport system ATP-binding protein
VALASTAGEPTDAVRAVLADRALVARVDDQNRYFELELAPGADAQVLLQRLVAAGAPIERFERVQPSLHQIFLEKVGATGVERG